jgi:hypothetical protein
MSTTPVGEAAGDEHSTDTLWDGVSPEVDAYFQATIGTYYCGDCAGEFSVKSVLGAARHFDRDVHCPVCGGDELVFSPLADPEKEGLDVDFLSGRGREACRRPNSRRHSDYEQPHWATCHVKKVDKTHVAEPVDEDDNEVRVDLDGLGSGGASTHDDGENLNLSVWLTREQARELGEDLVENADGGAAQ